MWRKRSHRSVPEMHQALLARGISIAERSVTYLMQRYEELVALRVTDHERIKARLRKQGHVILAIDGLQHCVRFAAYQHGPVEILRRIDAKCFE